MFNSITWTQYLLTIILILIIYYLYVAFKYYPLEIKRFVAGKTDPDFGQREEEESDPQLKMDFNGNPEQQTPIEKETNTAEIYDLIEKMVDKLKDRVVQASQENLMKGELAAELREIVSEYAQLKDTPYRSAINELILFECTEHKISYLSEEDIEALW